MLTKGENKLFLLDAYALIYRAYFAFITNPLKNSKGQNVSAITGFVNNLWELMQNEKPSHLAVVFDSAEQTKREADHSFYKAHREAAPEDIVWSIPYIKQIIDAFHIPRLELGGYEADDIIGTIAKKKAAEGHTVYMVTPDKDYAQLVSENIYIYKPGRQEKGPEILGLKEICANWEVQRPEQVIDILGIWGDAVDNIPGIPGVGEKTAKKLIKEFGSLEGILANTDKLKGKQKENVENNIEQAKISKQLATILLDVPIDVSDDDLLISEPDKEKLKELFIELEFRTIGKKILGDSFTVNVGKEEIKSKSATKTVTTVSGQADLFGETAVEEIASDLVKDGVLGSGRNIHNTSHAYHLCNSKDQIRALIAVLESAREFCWDTETTGLDPLTAEVIGMSFAVKPAEAFYVPIPSNFEEACAFIQAFKGVFADNSKLKIGQNTKFDINMLKKYGIDVSLPYFDTMLAHYLLEPNLKHGMDFMSETYLGYTPVHIEELIGKKGKDQKKMNEVPIGELKEYAAEDADITWQLAHHFKPLLRKKELTKLFEEVEIPLLEVLADMEYTGIRIDSENLNQYSLELQEELIVMRDEIWKLAGTEFNIDSPKQLGDILFGHMKIPFKGKKTATGQLSTNEETLQAMKDEHPIMEKILEYREIAKLKSTYVEALPRLVNEKTGRIHTTFNQTIAATGRLASLNPNLQNIPIRSDRGKRIRKAFIASDENHILLSADYSQIELRIMAEMSGDENMIEAFRNGEDIHQATAAKVYGIPLSEVSKEMRSKAKMVNFGIIYSISAFGLAQRLGIPRTEAAELIQNYFKQYPRIKEFMDKTLLFAREHGYVQTILGRRRDLPDIESRNQTVRGVAEREAINSPIQGSAADMIKVAMINIFREFKKRKLKSKMLLQVHDELVFDVLKSELEEVKEIVQDKMRHAIPMNVPIEADAGVGTNWLEAH